MQAALKKASTRNSAAFTGLRTVTTAPAEAISTSEKK